MIIDDIGEEYTIDNRSKRFLCYKAIVRAKFGQLGKGERIRLVVCCENMVRHTFLNDIGEAYVGYQRTYNG